MREFKEITGRRVYFADEGKEDGVVKDMLIDTKEFKVAGFVVRDNSEKYLPYEKVKHMEGDSVMAGRESDVENFPEKNYLKGSGLKGLKIMTESGKMMGNVATFYFEPSGRITHYEVSGGVFRDITEGHRLLPGAGVKVIGPDAVIVSDEVEKIVEDMKQGGGGAADAASRLGESFREAVRDFEKKGVPWGKAKTEAEENIPDKESARTKKDEIENKIEEKESEIKDKISEKTENAEKEAKKQGERAKERAEETAKEAELKAGKIKRKTEEKAEDIRDEIKKKAGEEDKNIRKKMDDIEKK